jgi:hypothetical protein
MAYLLPLTSYFSLYLPPLSFYILHFPFYILHFRISPGNALDLTEPSSHVHRSGPRFPLQVRPNAKPALSGLSAAIAIAYCETSYTAASLHILQRSCNSFLPKRNTDTLPFTFYIEPFTFGLLRFSLLHFSPFPRLPSVSPRR